MVYHLFVKWEIGRGWFGKFHILFLNFFSFIDSIFIEVDPIQKHASLV